MTPILLLVEDDAMVANALEVALSQGLRCRVIKTHSLKEALNELVKTVFNVIVLDLSLPDCNGKDTLVAIQRAAPATPIIVITGGDVSCNYIEAIQLGAQDFLRKGDFSFREMVRTVKHAIERHKVRKLFIPIEHDIEKIEESLKSLTSLVQKGNK